MSLWGWSMGVPIEGPLVHPGMSVLGLDAVHAIPTLGCRLIAVVVTGPMVRLPDSHV